jgi:hypothetical protein
MEWKVGNALNRDVERQHLNKILAEIRAALDARTTTSSTPTTNTVSTVTRYAVARFTITLQGDVTGSAEVDGRNDVVIETTLGDTDFITDAPIDSRYYWRRNGEWQRVPMNIAQRPDGVGLLVQTLDDENVPYNIVRDIAVTPGELTVADADGQSGDPTLGLANSGVVAGTYGDEENIPQITFDAKGRATEVNLIPIDVSGGILPMVTGDVPPELVYLEDGSLVYYEVD